MLSYLKNETIARPFESLVICNYQNSFTILNNCQRLQIFLNVKIHYIHYKSLKIICIVFEKTDCSEKNIFHHARDYAFFNAERLLTSEKQLRGRFVKSLTRARVAQYDSRHTPGKSRWLLRVDLIGSHDDGTMHIRGKVHSFPFDFFQRARSMAIKKKRKRSAWGGDSELKREVRPSESPRRVDCSQLDFIPLFCPRRRKMTFLLCRAASRLLSTLFLHTKWINIFAPGDLRPTLR